MYCWSLAWKILSITFLACEMGASPCKEAEVEWFYKDLQDFLELTPKKDVLFFIGDWNAEVFDICPLPKNIF